MVAACVDQVQHKRLAAKPGQTHGLLAGVGKDMVLQCASDRGLADAQRRCLVHGYARLRGGRERAREMNDKSCRGQEGGVSGSLFHGIRPQAPTQPSAIAAASSRPSWARDA